MIRHYKNRMLINIGTMTPTSARMKIERMSKLELKAKLIFFLNIKGVIMNEWVPSGWPVNQKCNREVLIKLRERGRKDRNCGRSHDSAIGQCTSQWPIWEVTMNNGRHVFSGV